MRLKAPHLENLFDYDPEADMFCAYGNNKMALEELGKLLAEAYHNHTLLRELIENSNLDDFDD